MDLCSSELHGLTGAAGIERSDQINAPSDGQDEQRSLCILDSSLKCSCGITWMAVNSIESKET